MCFLTILNLNLKFFYLGSDSAKKAALQMQKYYQRPAPICKEPTAKDVHFCIELPTKDCMLGQSLEMRVVARNSSTEGKQRFVKLHVSAIAVFHTGIASEPIFACDHNLILHPKEGN